MKKIMILALSSLCCITALAQRGKFANIGVGVNHTTADSLLMSHFNVALFGNVDTLHGFQGSLFMSVVRQETKGVNAGALSAMTRGKMYGVQMAGFINGIDGEARGVQMASVKHG